MKRPRKEDIKRQEVKGKQHYARRGYGCREEQERLEPVSSLLQEPQTSQRRLCHKMNPLLKCNLPMMMNYVPTSTSYKHKTYTDSMEGGVILRQGCVLEKRCANRTQSSSSKQCISWGLWD